MLVVADAGPLIYLSVVGQIDLLRRVYGRVLVPSVVFDEVVVGGSGLVGSKEVAAAKWIEVVTVDTNDPDVHALLAVLNAGEAAALALARRERADLVLIDEIRGRRVAQRLHLRVEGTLGLLVRGKRAGEVKEVAPLLRMMIDAGFWISDEVVQRVLDAAGETSAGDG